MLLHFLIEYLVLICEGELQGWVFALSLLGIMPMAERLGYATE